MKLPQQQKQHIQKIEKTYIIENEKYQNALKKRSNLVLKLYKYTPIVPKIFELGHAKCIKIRQFSL